MELEPSKNVAIAVVSIVTPNATSCTEFVGVSVNTTRLQIGVLSSASGQIR